MSKQVTITLDSGAFLPIDPEKKPAYREIGYFRSVDSLSDVSIQVDGEEVKVPELSKLVDKCVIEICHKSSDNTAKRDGVTQSASFHDCLLHTKDLYGEDIEVDRDKFDWVLYFQSGRFSESKVKTRAFKNHKKQKDNSLVYDATHEPKKPKPVAHDVKICYTLEDGESIEFQRDGKPIWSSSQYKVKERLDIEIVAENSTAEKFYRDSFKYERDSYWLPNQGDPPPLCSWPPCDSGGANG